MAMTSIAGYPALADGQAKVAKPDKTYTGTVKSVNANDRLLEVNGFMFGKRFNLGDNCTYDILNKNAGSISDLRSGERVVVSYQDAHGVLVADRVAQEPMKFDGMVKTIDPMAHTVTLHSGWMDRTFRIPDDCQIALRGGKTGTIADIQAGNHVTVTYETPNGQATARQIAQTSAMFTGELTAVDMNDRTVKAKTTFGAKKFNLADNCAIMVNGKPTGQLTDLRLGDRLEFNYDDVNGVNVVNRIANAPAPQETEMTSAQRMMAP